MSRPFQRGIAHKAVCHVVGGNSPFPIKAASVLRNEHEAGIGTIVDAFRPGITQTPSPVMGRPFVKVHQQTVPLGIPFGVGLEVYPERESPDAGDDTKQSARQAIGWVGGTSRVTVVVFLSRPSLRIVNCMGRSLCSRVVERVRVGLIHIVEAA